MQNVTIARTYASALFQLTEETGELERVNEEVTFFARLLRADSQLLVFLESPNIEGAEKRAVVEAALRGRLSDTFVKYVLLVLRKERQLWLRESLEEFRVLHDEKVGLVHARAVTAVPLDEETGALLREALEAKLQKRVDLENVVNEGILGGLIVRYDGMVADGSLSTALGRIEAQMREIKFGSELVHEDQP